MAKIVIVAHGQPGDPAPQQQAVEKLAAKIAPFLPKAQVVGATLAMPGALDVATDDAVIYPMFMAGGWFTRSELPRRLKLAGAGAAHIMPPFGADPNLPDLCRHVLMECANRQGWDLDKTHILLAAHGSGRSRAPAQAAYQMAQDLAPLRTTCGFIEEPPHIADAARDLPAQTICLPLFATRAGHIIEDLPQALDAANFQGVTLPPIGMMSQVPEMIAASIAKEIGAAP